MTESQGYAIGAENRGASMVDAGSVNKVLELVKLQKRLGLGEEG
ncbi:MAG: hypothetical protein NZ902_05485 [Acidilobaceae archaeon]|nr:hypothetical protein [Acidilobaceae archaeon]MCX8166018.1 hypothetical protein [Acidilobaceae archaeon]MDW7974659.1 hypothetical protein [Sulfolobales archaeon]